METNPITSTKKHLTAVLLAWIFLEKPLNPKQIIGLSLAAIGIIIVQVWRGKRHKTLKPS